MHESQKKQKQRRSARRGGTSTNVRELQSEHPLRCTRLSNTTVKHRSCSEILPEQHNEGKGENPANESLIDHIRNTSGPEADAYSDEFLLNMYHLAGDVVEDIMLGRSKF